MYRHHYRKAKERTILPAALSAWFHSHYYLAILVATIIEGLGIPLPAEALFIGTGLLVHRGEASLSVVITLAALGNLIGSFTGYSVAYLGGKKLLARAARALRLKPEALEEVDRFFLRYGSATIFFSRFIGFIRAATIYSSGAARVEPLRFAGYVFAGALIWNGGWAFLAFHFGAGLPRLIHHLARRPMAWVGVVAVVCVGLGLWYLTVRKRGAADS